MFVARQKLFVLVSLPHSGIYDTAHRIFQRSSFFPFKGPIRCAGFGEALFAVLNVHNYRLSTREYLRELRRFLRRHGGKEVHLVLNLVLYTEGTHAMGEVIRELNRTSLDIHYLVLQSNYINRQVMSSELLAVLKGWIKQGTVHVNDTLVMGSQIRLDQRAEELCAVIRQVVAS
ncbi:hypothetical protein SAMN05444266_105486 [Chitinophaga jiangningensis]|uniref:Uncharacterized protein n=1 Tax=Chitinophaga jiangningensis TaxID=1419482 RepID=A0A1M7EL60_9BACT|nr:hypothetical protein SAMN05444266_105486 [Chitinophaga jiangningensis]